MFEPNCLKSKVTFGHSAAGWILPCCWLDPNEHNIDDHRVQALFTEELKIENVDSIEDILFSKAWLNFMDMIKSAEDVPLMCKFRCEQV